MAYNPNREEKKLKDLKFNIFLIMGISLYAGLFLGAEAYKYSEDGIVSHLEDLMTDFTSVQPFDKPLKLLGFSIEGLPGALHLFPTDPRWLLIALIIGASFCLQQYIDYILHKNMRPNEEHGSSGFSTNYSQLTHDLIMSAPILKKAMINGDIKITFWDRIYVKIFCHTGLKKTLDKKKKEEFEDQKEQEQMDIEEFGTNEQIEKKIREDKTSLDDSVLSGKQKGDAVL